MNYPKILIQQACLYFNIEENELLSKSRKKHYVLVRVMLAYILRYSKMNYTYMHIAAVLRRSDHSHIIHYLKCHDNYVQTNYSFYLKMFNAFLEYWTNYQENELQISKLYLKWSEISNSFPTKDGINYTITQEQINNLLKDLYNIQKLTTNESTD